MYGFQEFAQRSEVFGHQRLDMALYTIEEHLFTGIRNLQE